jgi:hypothetical protein
MREAMKFFENINQDKPNGNRGGKPRNSETSLE